MNPQSSQYLQDEEEDEEFVPGEPNMRLIEARIAELFKLDVAPNAEEDFAAFWEETTERVARAKPVVKDEVLDYPADNVEVHDVTFTGLDGTPVEGWWLFPTGKTEPLPGIARFHGGQGSRGCPFDHFAWVAAGFAVMTLDFRCQGGRTGSLTPLNICAATHWMTANIEDYRNSYFYHIWTDALLALRIFKEHPRVDRRRVAATGASQGGGMALAMAALDRDIALCLADVFSGCWWEKRIETRTAGGSYIAEYLRRRPEATRQVFQTLSYYDVLNLVDRIRCPVRASCCLKDPAIPPECVFAGYNRITSDKDIEIYPLGDHVVPPVQIEKELRFAREFFGVTP